MKKRNTMDHYEGYGIDIPAELQEAFAEIVSLTDEFCCRHLNEEYRHLCADMAAELCQLEVPIYRGRRAGWASGIVHAAGFVNFLHDPSQSPHMTSPEIAEGFGISKGTMQSRSKIIRDELDMIQLDPDWCLPALLDDNPLVWMLEVDGMAVDIRTAPRGAQEEAYRQGLIPYIPADREKPKPQPDSGPKIIQFRSACDALASAEAAAKTKDQSPGLFDELSE
jgi:hypothetical protein